MNESVIQFAVESVEQRVGIPVEGHPHAGEDLSFDLLPVGPHPNESFSVRFTAGWRTAEAKLIPGKFSAPLIAQMGESVSESSSAVAAFAQALDARKARVTFRVNGMDVSPLDRDSWPPDWTRFELHARSAPQVIEKDDIAQMRQLTADLLIPVFGMVAALVGVEDDEEFEPEGALEGTPYQTLVTRYERKKVNREACIQLKGTRCVVCGFDFGAAYGALGTGYVEVHHTTPVSEMGPDYRVDVAADLEPLCSNCHAMAHRRSPPVSIDELTQMVADRNR